MFYFFLRMQNIGCESVFFNKQHSKEELMKQLKPIGLCRVAPRLAILLAVGLTTLSIPAGAAEWYGAASLGQTKLQEDVCGDLTALGFTPCSEDLTDTGWKLAIGNQFNPNVALEFGYADLGEAKVTAAGVSCKADANGFGASVVGSLPAANQLSFTGRVGLFRWDESITCSAGAASVSDSDSGTDLAFGVGVRYDITKTVGVRGEWERYDLDDADVDMLSFGVVVKFK
jgi:OOP family OmpA-OmpF porin